MGIRDKPGVNGPIAMPASRSPTIGGTPRRTAAKPPAKANASPTAMVEKV